MIPLILAALVSAAPDGSLMPGAPKVCSGHSEPILSVAISPDGKFFASGAADNTARLWDSATRAELAKFTDSKAYITSVAFSPDSTLLAAGDAQFVINVYDVKTKAVKVKLLFADVVSELVFSPDGTRLAAAGEGGTGQIFNLADGKPLLELRAKSVAWSKDGKQVLTSAAGPDLFLYDLAKKKPGKPITIDRSARVLSSGNFSTVVLWSPESPLLSLWDVSAGKKRGEFVGHKIPLGSAALSADGTLLVSGSKGQFARVWTVADQKIVKEFPVQRQPQVAISTDNQTVVVGDGIYVKVWSLGGVP